MKHFAPSSKRKLEWVLAEILIEDIKDRYNIVLSDHRAMLICRHFINQYKKLYETNLKSNHRINNLLKNYWLTTKIPKGEINNHSAFFFAQFINRYYHLFFIKKDSFVGKILNKLI